MVLSSHRRNEESPTKKTKQDETISSAYTTVVTDNRSSEDAAPSGNTIYADVEMIQQPKPSNTIYASVQATSDPADMGESVVYADLDFPQKVR